MATDAEVNAMEMLDFQCPYCKRILKVPADYLGKTGKCNHCGNKVTIRITAAFPKRNSGISRVDADRT